MSSKFTNSGEGYSPNLFLFQAPPVDGSTELVQWQDYRPTNLLAKSSPIEFNIPGTSSHYIDLKRSRLYVKAKIINPTTSTVNVDDDVAFTNLSLHSIFRQVDVSLQQTVISPGVGTCYPYKSYFDTILSSTPNPAELESQLFYKDESGLMDDVVAEGRNSGFVSRWALTSLPQSVDMEGSLC